MSLSGSVISAITAFGLLACAHLAAPAFARAGAYGDRLVAEGNDFFKAGNFFRASESYRCAVLEEPADGQKKLQFGHALYALGNYAYAAYSFRRGVRYLGYPDDLRVELVQGFGSRLSYDRALRDVRRYAAYYPSDPHALTVIAYISYFGGDRPEAEVACKRLLSIDPRDAFAAYLQRRIELEASGAPATPALAPAPAPRDPESVMAPIAPPRPAAAPVGSRPSTPVASTQPPTTSAPPIARAPASSPAGKGAIPGGAGRTGGASLATPITPEPPPEGMHSDPALLLSEDEVATPALAR